MKALLHAHIQKINQPLPHCVMLEVYGPQGRQQWLFSTHPRLPRIGQSWQSLKNPAIPPIFCLWLRTRILHAEFSQIDLLQEHLWQFALRRGDGTHFLIWEENGPQSNLLLLDEHQRLLLALHNPNQAGRPLKQKMDYAPPVQWLTAPPLPALPQHPKERDACLWKLEQAENTTHGKVPYQKHFKALKKKLARRLEKQEKDLENCQNSTQFQQWGELLKPRLWEVKPGQKTIEVLNYYAKGFPAVVIPLNPQYSPEGNLTRLFQKADKLKKAIPHVEKRILQTLHEQDALQLHQERLLEVETLAEFQSWEKALPRFLQIPKRSAPAQTKNQLGRAVPFTRLSSEGWMMVIGRNKHQNAYVTFTIARGNDWWFHAQGVAGSHVIVKCPQAALPQRTLLEAAQLAAYYCKARSHGKVEVDYTQRKHVRKLKGGAPGTVTYSHNKTIFVELNEALLQDLLAREASL